MPIENGIDHEKSEGHLVGSFRIASRPSLDGVVIHVLDVITTSVPSDGLRCVIRNKMIEPGKWPSRFHDRMRCSIAFPSQKRRLNVRIKVGERGRLAEVVSGRPRSNCKIVEIAYRRGEDLLEDELDKGSDRDTLRPGSQRDCAGLHGKGPGLDTCRPSSILTVFNPSQRWQFSFDASSLHWWM